MDGLNISILAVLADRDNDGYFRDAVGYLFQSSRSLRTATKSPKAINSQQNISILAVLADRDSWPCWATSGAGHFNPRGPCGPRLASQWHQPPTMYFNPRGPCGPRHPAQPVHSPPRKFQSSRSLRTATENKARTKREQTFQSSRSLRTATCFCQLLMVAWQLFQSSRSLRTATNKNLTLSRGFSISILAVLADRDQHVDITALSMRLDFNPRGPCGPRRESGAMTACSKLHFNPRGPCGPRPQAHGQHCSCLHISILAVLADRDYSSRQPTHCPQDFNPRGPCGPRRHYRCHSAQLTSNFNPRGPCGPRQQRRTKDLPHLCTKRRIFSPHQKVFCGKDGKTNVFPPLPRAFSGANLPGSVRALGPRTRSSGSLPAGRSACSQSARSCSRISFPGSKNADYPAPDP